MRLYIFMRKIYLLCLFITVCRLAGLNSIALPFLALGIFLFYLLLVECERNKKKDEFVDKEWILFVVNFFYTVAMGLLFGTQFFLGSIFVNFLVYRLIHNRKEQKKSTQLLQSVFIQCVLKPLALAMGSLNVSQRK